MTELQYGCANDCGGLSEHPDAMCDECYDRLTRDRARFVPSAAVVDRRRPVEDVHRIDGVDVVSEYEFRVTVEDLRSGEKRAMEFGTGDYILIPFAPCRRDGVQVYATKGTHVITVKDYRPSVKSREVDPVRLPEGETP